MFRAKWVKTLRQHKQNVWIFQSGRRPLWTLILSILSLSMPLSSEASSDPFPQCQQALSIKHDERKDLNSPETFSSEPLFSELVELILSSVSQGETDSPWRSIDVRSLIAEKKAEIARLLGHDASILFFQEAQSRVTNRVLRSRDETKLDQTKTRRDQFGATTKVRVFSPRWVGDLIDHGDRVMYARFSPDGTKAVTTSRDKTAKLWDAQTGRLIRIFGGHDERVISAVISPDGTKLATASADGTAKLWDAKRGSLIQTFKGHSDGLYSVVFSPDGTKVLTASADGTAKLWDTTTDPSKGKLVGLMSRLFKKTLIHSFKGHSKDIRIAVFSPNGEKILTASDDYSAKLWDAKTGQHIHTLKGHNREVFSAVFSPDGSQVLTGSADKTGRLWDIRTGQLLHSLDGHTGQIRSAVFSPDGLLAVTASWDNTMKLWDAKTGDLLHSFSSFRSMIHSANFSPDGKKILTASDSGMAQFWDVQTGFLIHTLEDHPGGCFSAVFSPLGDQVLTVPRDDGAKLWSVYSIEELTSDAPDEVKSPIPKL
jgi:WD40 repeat protein